jgi:hypothetical protein
MSVPTTFLDANTRYDAVKVINMNTLVSELRDSLILLKERQTRSGFQQSQITEAQNAVNTKFNAVANYFNEMSLINDFLKGYINKQSNNLAENSSSSVSAERYKNRIHPEEAVLARESTYGLMPELRVRSLPYLLAISVFMASLTIFLIFQTFGFSGQVNLPSSITGWLSSPASPLPFYSNPLFLGGVVILLLVTVIIFAVLYFKSKNANK